MARVFYAVLHDKQTHWRAVNSLINVAMACGAAGAVRLAQTHKRTDLTRNDLIKDFLHLSKDRDDVLVMLDNDHEFPDPYIVQRLAASEFGITTALAFRRGSPFDPIMFVRCADGKLHPVAQWEANTVIRCDMAGHGAIAIKRGVFDDLAALGFEAPYYRYEYPADGSTPSEDMYFGRICEAAGVPFHCDTRLIIPHLIDDTVDDQTWLAWLAMHPGQTTDKEQVTGADAAPLKISVILPTRGRAQQAKACVTRCLDTAPGVEVIVLTEDELTIRALKDTGAKVIVHTGRAVEKWNAGAAQATGDVWVLAADDLWWSDTWASDLQRAINRLPERCGVVGLNTLEPPRDFSTHYAMTRTYAERFTDGHLCPPYYRQYFVDVETCTVARNLGRYVYAAECVVEHRHPLWHKAKDDNTYQRSQRHYEDDQAIFEQRQAQGFPAPAVQELLAYARQSPDLAEYVDVLRDYAAQCTNVVELGVRTGYSTAAFISGGARVINSYDLKPCPNAERLSTLAAANEVDWRFTLGDSRTVDIGRPDLLFIDTDHNYAQLSAELTRHAPHVERWIMLHDTHHTGSDVAGMWRAITELRNGGQWRLRQDYPDGCGLTILERVP